MNYRQKRNYLNQQRRIFDGVGKYGIPQLQPCTVNLEGVSYIPFNEAMSNRKDAENKVVHFFIDDYQFERLWKSPDDYINMLSQFRAITVPDFSTYRDYPMALQIFNHFRKHWIGAYYQEMGLEVIPIISWSTEESFEWCFDGEPVNSLIATSTVGSFSDDTGKALFDAGWTQMMKKLNPKEVLLYTSETKYQSSLNKRYEDDSRVSKINNSVIERIRANEVRP